MALQQQHLQQMLRPTNGQSSPSNTVAFNQATGFGGKYAPGETAAAKPSMLETDANLNTILSKQSLHEDDVKGGQNMKKKVLHKKSFRKSKQFSSPDSMAHASSAIERANEKLIQDRIDSLKLDNTKEGLQKQAQREIFEKNLREQHKLNEAKETATNIMIKSNKSQTSRRELSTLQERVPTNMKDLQNATNPHALAELQVNMPYIQGIRKQMNTI